jgi:hypothetical protein
MLRGTPRLVHTTPPSAFAAPVVIPGPLEGRSPEPMHTGLWKIGSGLAAEAVLGPRLAWIRGRRPGMTIGPLTVLHEGRTALEN